MAHIDIFQAELDRFREACRDQGVKATHQRLEIFREVARSDDHPDAEAVYRGVKSRVPTVSLDTVYRTLKMLTDLGFISTLGHRQESLRFDANLQPHHHHICVKCGRVQDLTQSLLDEENVKRVVRTFGTLQTAHIEVRGLCNGCAKRSSSS